MEGAVAGLGLVHPNYFGRRVRYHTQYTSTHLLRWHTLSYTSMHYRTVAYTSIHYHTPYTPPGSIHYHTPNTLAYT